MNKQDVNACTCQDFSQSSLYMIVMKWGGNMIFVFMGKQCMRHNESFAVRCLKIINDSSRNLSLGQHASMGQARYAKQQNATMIIIVLVTCLKQSFKTESSERLAHQHPWCVPWRSCSKDVCHIRRTSSSAKCLPKTCTGTLESRRGPG